MRGFFTRLKLAIKLLVHGLDSFHDYIVKDLSKDIPDNNARDVIASGLVANVLEKILVYMYNYSRSDAQKAAAHAAVAVIYLARDKQLLTLQHEKHDYYM